LKNFWRTARQNHIYDFVRVRLKTSLLFLQKWNNNPKQGPICSYKEDYPIFMAASKKSGKNSSGEYVYLKDKNGNFVKDNEGNLVINHDLDEIAEAFVKFAKEQKFSFI